jgi:hypothetical protein
MNYVIEMDSGSIMEYIQSLINIGLEIQKLIIGMLIQTHRQTCTQTER